MERVRGLILNGRQQLRILDRSGTVLLDWTDDGRGGRPEVQRGGNSRSTRSRPALSTGNSKARTLDDGRHEVTFAEGDTTLVDDATEENVGEILSGMFGALTEQDR